VASEEFTNVFALLKSGREGVQFERTFRAISFLLHEWYEYQSRDRSKLIGSVESQGHHHRNREMRSIPFDKLVTLWARLWNNAYALHDVLQLESQNAAALNGYVTFPCPMTEVAGKHGPGRAIFDGVHAPEFIISVLHKLQEDDIIHYFSIPPPRDADDTTPRGSAPPTHPETTIRPALPITDRRAYLDRFTTREVDLLVDLANAIKRLDTSEIRALGTHENRDKTVAAIKFEFRALKKRGILESIRSAIAINAPFAAPAQDWLEYAEEAHSKAHSNRDAYESAWGTVDAELSDDEAKSVFRFTQATSSEIWDAPKIKALCLLASKSLAVARYFRLVSEGLEGGDRKLDDRLQTASAECQEFGISLPESVDELFSPHGTLLPQSGGLLANVLERTFQEMMKNS